jgi:hypothetical protein
MKNIIVHFYENINQPQFIFEIISEENTIKKILNFSIYIYDDIEKALDRIKYILIRNDFFTEEESWVSSELKEKVFYSIQMNKENKFEEAKIQIYPHLVKSNDEA